ncbi:hypothetical protein HY383_02580 [Candidatus Daviesbacteria bacterium]|nr:hypothetical protein [Candidatus Daviesbacteria bacterium]
MLKTPFYDPNKSYEDNYNDGPFGAFNDGQVYEQTGEPEYDFFGQKIYLPFGIPAGPLLNSKFCKAAFEKGFDICVYKTVRANVFPSHPYPNILSVKVDGDLTLEKAQGKLIGDTNYPEPLSITNSFGVPSKDPSVWQEDVKKAISFAGKGQVLVLSFMGTVRENQTEQDFIEDWRQAARLSKQTGARVFEANLSCPNIGNEGLVCYNLDMTGKVCKAIREELGDSPLVLKVGYFQNDEDIKRLVEVASQYAQGIAAINTIAAEIVDKDGNQALPGKNRLKSGVCGAAIRWAGLDMARKLKSKIKDQRLKILVIGVGGVTKSEDYFEYKQAGADIVMSATGAMWNPYLAQEIKKEA